MASTPSKRKESEPDIMYNYKMWSDVKSEVRKPFYKVRFVPGKRVVYCAKSDLQHVAGGLAKEIANGKCDDLPNYQPDYKVRFPGQRVVPPGTRYGLRTFNDPRIGVAQRVKDSVFHELDINDHSDYSVSDDDSEWEVIGSEEDASDEEELERWIEDGSDKELEQVIINPDMETEFVSVDKLPPSPSPPSPKIKFNLKKEEKKEKQRLRQCYNRAVVNEAQTLKNQDCECAEAAIGFYNYKHDTDYEIVETLGSYCSLYAGFWFHCNFRARRKRDADCIPPSKPKLFFAELSRKEADTLVVENCQMLDGPGHRPDIIRGCKICGNQLCHPVHGFKTGK